MNFERIFSKEEEFLEYDGAGSGEAALTEEIKPEPTTTTTTTTAPSVRLGIGL